MGGVPRFDLVVADEAHRCAGSASPGFRTVLNNEAIRTDRRLFMTATPRYLTARTKKAAMEADLALGSAPAVAPPSFAAGRAQPSAPRAYRLKASNAAPPISTFAAAIPANFRGPLTSLTLFRSAAGSLQIATRRCFAWPRTRPGPPNLPEAVDRRICPCRFHTVGQSFV